MKLKPCPVCKKPVQIRGYIECEIQFFCIVCTKCNFESIGWQNKESMIGWWNGK